MTFVASRHWTKEAQTWYRTARERVVNRKTQIRPQPRCRKFAHRVNPWFLSSLQKYLNNFVKYPSSSFRLFSTPTLRTMSPNERDQFPPPYTEYGSRPPNGPSTPLSSSRGQTILDQLNTTRTRHIRSVIETHIIPLVEQQAAYGIAQTIIAMLPSDIPLPPVEEKSEFSFATDDAKPVEVIGFSSEDEPKVVRLEGHMNRTEFWRPQAVIEELERVLSEDLNASAVLRSPTGRGRAGSGTPQRQPRRTLLSRVMPSMGPEQPSPGGNPEVGVKPLDNTRLVVVKARLEELCLRTVTEFGLYDTMSKQCVIIRVDARC
ncbi:hypothetical protein BDW02DRAFT_569194 [Decorospora gaudefroyi]|uniref:Uncharacterized protein n=1 Tax=Decorospora gaudefroyi TaxID=184978 RepID=A0A6A5KLC6_9PLEO|nr:hypothetical protein BDW02DRAFT_569194 [Decorospora gaudefroyi]